MQRAALFSAICLPLLLAASPTVYWRLDPLLDSDPITGLPRPRQLVSIEGVPFVSGLLVPARTRDDLEGVVAAIRARTQDGEPIFVYPTSPLLYVASERPNPTRFAHLYPGAATDAELREVMEQLDRGPVRLVVISDVWLDAWGPAGANQPLEDYLAAHYAEVERFGAYRVLERADVPAPSGLR
jgi:hypothetical protein